MSLHIRCIETTIGDTRLFGALTLVAGPWVKVRISRAKRGGKEVLFGTGTWTSEGLADVAGLPDSERVAIEAAIRELL